MSSRETSSGLLIGSLIKQFVNTLHNSDGRSAASAWFGFELGDTGFHDCLDQGNREGLVQPEVDGPFGGGEGFQLVFELVDDRGSREQAAMVGEGGEPYEHFLGFEGRDSVADGLASVARHNRANRGAHFVQGAAGGFRDTRKICVRTFRAGFSPCRRIAAAELRFCHAGEYSTALAEGGTKRSEEQESQGDFSLRRPARSSERTRKKRRRPASFELTAAGRLLETFRRDFVTGGFERAGAAPAPNKDDVFDTGVVEAVPVAAGRENNVALAGRLAAAVGVEEAAARNDDEKFVGVGMAMLVVARAGRKNGPADEELVRARGFLVDEEADLHVDPAIVALEPADAGYIAEIRAVGLHVHCEIPPRRR